MTGAPTPSPDTPQGEMTPAQKTAAAIAAAAQQRQQISSLAEALIPQTQPGAILSKGKVMSWESGLPPTVTIQLGGDTSTSISAVRYLDSYTPTPGDTVIIAKQGSEILVLGKAHEFYLNQPAKDGWQAISPTSTWNGSNNNLTPPLWRRVFDHGAQKIQFQGRLWRVGSNTGTTMFTLPVGYRPGIQRALLAARENLSNGSNVIQLLVGTDGSVAISGQTLGATGGTYGTISMTSSYGMQGSENLSGATYLGKTDASHQHGMFHTHNISVDNAVFPGWVSLDGIEFFL